MPKPLTRTLNIAELLKRKSFFLLGPRATGKSSLTRMQLSETAFFIDLLESELYLRLSADPGLLEGLINAHNPDTKQVVIDEIQRIPSLLNEVHRLIESRGITFLLTGSSARKLRGKGVNLLAGRAWEAALFPLTSQEIGKLDLARYLQVGGLPSVYLSEYPEEELKAYVNTYLKEEIQAEALVRKIPAFSRFLQVAALTSGQELNFESLASDMALSASTVREYYHILEDTLVGFLVPGWTKSQKRKGTSRAKFYFFDTGIRHQLAGIHSLSPQTDAYGQAFEHFIAMELRAYLSYSRQDKTLAYWRTKNGQEVDFLVGNDLAIEVKTSERVTSKHLRGLKALEEEGICRHFLLVSFDPIPRVEDGIEILPWGIFLKRLWASAWI